MHLKSSGNAPVMRKDDPLAIGEVSARSGIAASAIRFYEAEGLITATRTPDGHRRFPRHTLRRLAFIRAAQRVGLSLSDVADALDTVPDGPSVIVVSGGEAVPVSIVHEREAGVGSGPAAFTARTAKV